MSDNRFATVAGDDLEALLEGVDTFREYLSAKQYRDFDKFTRS